MSWPDSAGDFQPEVPADGSVDRFVQQALAAELGEYKALRSCAPTCFFMLGKAAGYLETGTGSDLVSFVRNLDWDNTFSEESGWVRPKLSAELRQTYGMEIVSCRMGGNTSADADTLTRMRVAGYLDSPREAEFYRDNIVGHDVSEVVAAGYPVMAGVLPSFGQNRRTHAVILNHWENGEVEVIDPDERNPENVYSQEYVRRFLNPTGGGCTIVLPRERS